jgi:hypothetical protein
MSELFILQNQEKLFLGKQNNWLDGREPGALFKTAYKDEAINQMFEASSKDYRQRIKIIGCSANEKGLPVIDPEIMPEPLPKPGKDLFDQSTSANKPQANEEQPSSTTEDLVVNDNELETENRSE